MTITLLIILSLILILPFTFRFIEHNLEYFLGIMGILATIISGKLSLDLIVHILENYLLYLITATVLVAGFIFRISIKKVRGFVSYVTQKIPLTVFVFLLIVVLGLVSSLITAIIASLILVEIVQALPLIRKQKVQLTIIACFSIGVGAALTPIGEPLSTIVVSILKGDFLYLFRIIGVYIFPCIIALGFFGAFYINRTNITMQSAAESEGNELLEIENENITQIENLQSIFIRAIKIFVFIIALELLGAGFKPLINTYILHLDSRILYWINTCSAVLDNATIAAAEISPKMSLNQIQAILMGLLLSGGMLIPGNIPNIIAAGKLNIKSREWATVGIPLGLALLLIYFVWIFVL